jgi:sporulation protein YlmC with PRC-barrel domain
MKEQVMFTKQMKLNFLLSALSLLLIASLSACLGPDNPLILNVASTPTADAEGAADAAPAEDAEAADVEVSEVVPEGTEAPNAIPVAEVNLASTLLQSTFLVNRSVANATGEEIGTVDDLVIDMQTGQIFYVILDRSTFLGLGANNQALPLTAFDWTNELNLILNIDETILETLPAVDDEWPTAVTEGWDTDIAAFWREQALLSERNPAAVPIRLRTLLGLHAGGLGADLGVIEDFLLYLNEERVAYLAIYSAEGFYTPDRVLIVPFTATTVEVQDVGGAATYGVTLLAVDEEVLNSAPSMDRSLFLTVDLIDQSFAEELDTYWSEQELTDGQ